MNIISSKKGVSRFLSRASVPKQAFTIVELIIVITVIAILASVTVIGYNGVLRNSRETAMKSDLQQTYVKLKSYVASNDTYPDNLGSNAVQSTGTVLDYSASSDGANFCLNASRTDSLNTFYIRRNGIVSQGTCGTPLGCFVFNASSREITGYYDNVDNNTSKGTCPKEVEIPRTINGVDVNYIGYQAFYRKGITSVDLPDTLDWIQEGAFQGNSLTKVVIPRSVTFIRKNAFAENLLTDVTLSATLNYMEDFAFAYNKISSITLPESLGASGVNFFVGNGNITCRIGAGSPYQNSNAMAIGCSTIVTY